MKTTLHAWSQCPDGNIRGGTFEERNLGKIVYRLFYLFDHLENNMDGCIRNIMKHEEIKYKHT